MVTSLSWWKWTHKWFRKIWAGCARMYNLVSGWYICDRGKWWNKWGWEVKCSSSNSGKFALELIEVQLGKYVGEHENIRLDLKYVQDWWYYKMKNKKVVIIEGLGCIEFNLVESLIPDYEVTVIDDWSTGSLNSSIFYSNNYGWKSECPLLAFFSMQPIVQNIWFLA